MEHLGTALLGGVAIGLATSALLVLNGRIAGISGIVGGLLRSSDDAATWRVAFLLGLASGGVILAVHLPWAFDGPSVPQRGMPVLFAAGLLVGVGTRLGSGCTSGHGVCGIGRGSRRSIVATFVFMATGMLTVWLVGLP